MLVSVLLRHSQATGAAGRPGGRWRGITAPKRRGAAMGQDAKPRTAVASRHGQRRGGASREARRPNIAPYRNGTRPRGAGGAHERRVQAVRVAMGAGGAAMGAGVMTVGRGCNGGRARCPHRAARVMRGRNGGAIMTSRRVRGPAAHHVADRAATCKTLSVCYLPSRAPRWRAATGKGAAARAGRPGGQTLRSTATGAYGDGARRRGMAGEWARGCEIRLHLPQYARGGYSPFTRNISIGCS